MKDLIFARPQLSNTNKGTQDFDNSFDESWDKFDIAAECEKTKNAFGKVYKLPSN